MSDQEGQTSENTEAVNSVESASRRRGRRRATANESSVNMHELRELIELIRENDFTEFELEREGFRVRFRRGADLSGEGLAAPQASQQTTTVNTAISDATVPPVPAHPGGKTQAAAAEDLDLHIIPSPIVGTFYRAPSPNADSFVKIGSRVEADTVVCIIEAMKLMNEIQAETTGEVAKIYVENGQPVEYGQPLFGIKK